MVCMYLFEDNYILPCIRFYMIFIHRSKHYTIYGYVHFYNYNHTIQFCLSIYTLSHTDTTL